MFKKVLLILLAIIVVGILVDKIFFNTMETVNGTEDTSHYPPIHILAGIDSLTNGRLYSTNYSRYLDDFVPVLKKKYGDGGPGYVPFDTLFFNREGGKLAFSSGLKEINNIPHNMYPATYSFDFKGLFTNMGHSDQVTMQLDDSWLSGKIFYLKQPGGGSFQVGYPRDESLKVNTSGISGLGVVILPPHKKGMPLVISHIRGKVSLFGGYFYNPNGMVVSRVGQGGDRLGWYAELNQYQLDQWIQVLKPDLFIFNGGMNDRKLLSQAQYKQALNRYLTPFRKVKCPLILTIPNAIYGDETRLKEYEAILRTYSKENHTGIVSNKEALGETFQQATNKGYMGDAIHPNVKGAKLISRHLLQYINSHSKFQKIISK